MRETTVAPGDLISLFVVHGLGDRAEIAAMPGNYHFSIDRLGAEADEPQRLGIGETILFRLPAGKDETGLESHAGKGVDVVIVMPALASLDVVARVGQRFALPIAAYNVSGEYSVVEAAAPNGWVGGRRVGWEVLTSIKRAGTDIISTYHAKEVVHCSRDGK
ncbi:MAG: hypothetical protein ACYC4L_01690 [Chloroflexota bacterium]